MNDSDNATHEQYLSDSHDAKKRPPGIFAPSAADRTPAFQATQWQDATAKIQGLISVLPVLFPAPQWKISPAQSNLRWPQRAPRPNRKKIPRMDHPDSSSSRRDRVMPATLD